MPPAPPPEAVALAEALIAAGEAAMLHYGRPEAVWRKADASPATSGDLAAERVLLDHLRRRWPDDRIRSEEAGEAGAADGALWVVDPIDGTSSFLEGLAYWGATAARLVDGEVRLGGLYLPRLQELYRVADGRAWFDDAPMEPLTGRAPPRVLYLPSGFHRHLAVDWEGKARCLGGTAAHLALVARGAAAAVIVPPAWSAWDTAAGLALIEAVGGRSALLPGGGSVHPLRDEGLPFIAGFPDAVEELLQPGRLHPLPRGPRHAGP